MPALISKLPPDRKKHQRRSLSHGGGISGVLAFNSHNDLIFAVVYFEKDGIIGDWEHCAPNFQSEGIMKITMIALSLAFFGFRGRKLVFLKCLRRLPFGSNVRGRPHL